MGNCVTVYKNKDVAGMDPSVRIQSPIKENNIADMGKAEESFFDSQPWLDSDCDDFFSVNGDSVSSSGNSPNHQKSFRESSISNKNQSTDAKKQLMELFRESIEDDDLSSKQGLENKASTRSPYQSIPNSARSSGTTPYGGCLPRTEKPAEFAHRCLPSLVRNMSFGERKKRPKTDGW